jgi:hypothetical protein
LYRSFGICLIIAGFEKYLKYGIFPYLNLHWQPIYPAAVIATGIVFVALCWLPLSLVEKLRHDKKTRDELQQMQDLLASDEPVYPTRKQRHKNRRHHERRKR